MYIVEAFTLGKDKSFTGNTAAVCLLEFDDDISDDLKQNIAMNMNLSETTFITKGWTSKSPLVQTNSSNRWTIRWFTPTIEYPLCGHATLAAAKIIFQEVLRKKMSPGETETTITFESKFRGELGATINWASDLITLNFPKNTTEPIAASEHPWLSAFIENTLGPKLGRGVVQDAHYSPGMNSVLLRLRDTKQGFVSNDALLREISPDFQGLLAATSSIPLKVGTLIVTIKGEDGGLEPHFLSRCFGPWSGINEDPVTGSAHTVLAPFWNKIIEQENEINLTTLVGIQTSKRGGKIICTLKGDRVYMAGSSRTVLEGTTFL